MDGVTRAVNNIIKKKQDKDRFMSNSERYWILVQKKHLLIKA